MTAKSDLVVAELGERTVVVIDTASKKPFCIPRSAISSHTFTSSCLSGKYFINFLEVFGRVCALRGIQATESKVAALTEASPMMSAREDYEALSASLDIFSTFMRRKWEGEDLLKMSSRKSSVPSPTLNDLESSHETRLTSICSGINALCKFSELEALSSSLYSEYVDTFDRATTFMLHGRWSPKNERSLVKEIELLLGRDKLEKAEVL